MCLMSTHKDNDLYQKKASAPDSADAKYMKVQLFAFKLALKSCKCIDVTKSGLLDI